MSAHDIAASQLKCVRLLSVILPDGTLPTPSNWGITAYPDYDPVPAPQLNGFFYENPEPSVPVLREQLRAYVDKFGLELTERPHGTGGLIEVRAVGMWQGVDLRMWGVARPEEASGSESV